MTFEESLKIERYKFVTGRQEYFTNLAKETFSAFLRAFAASATGGAGLISLRKQLSLDPTVVSALLNAIGVLLTVAAVISVIQIVFCLARWYGFRNAECEINSAAPKPELWALLFEGMYCMAIAVFTFIAWLGICRIESILMKINA